MTRGGKRPGAGPKPLPPGQKADALLRVPSAALAILDRLKARLGGTRGQIALRAFGELEKAIGGIMSAKWERDKFGRYSWLHLRIGNDSGALYVRQAHYCENWCVEAITGECEWFNHLKATNIDDAEREAVEMLRARLNMFAEYSKALNEMGGGNASE